MRRSRRPAALLVAALCAVATGCGTPGEGAAKASAAGAGTSVLASATGTATVTGPEGAGSSGPSPSGPVVVASSAAPSALSGLAPYLTAVQRADAALQHAATLVNGDVGSAELRIGPATRDAIRSVDLAATARELPAGMPAALTRQALLVYSELASRRAAFSGVLAVTTGPDGTARLPATSPDMTRIRGCLANGATANARFRGDLATLRALAASTPPFTAPRADSRAVAEIAVRTSYVDGWERCCAGCGGYLADRLVPVVWHPGPAAAGRPVGTIAGVPFEADFREGGGWVVVVHAG